MLTTPLAPPVPFAGVPADSHIDCSDVVRGAFLAAVLDGTEPFTQTIRTSEHISVETVMPPEATILRASHDSQFSMTYAICADGSLLARVARGYTMVTTSGTTRLAASTLANRILARIPNTDTPERTKMRTWHLASHGANASGTEIETPRWDDISRNYPPPVAAKLSKLTSTKSPGDNGRLILWHGAPGTGKTSAIRSLAREWRPWCDVEYVADPGRLFGNPEYLFEVFLGKGRDSGNPQQSSSAGNQRWRLIVAEDSDEYLRSDARSSRDGSLGRILNLTDGILGQGSRTLVLLTTNEDVEQLDPALVRPGRCLSQVEFRRFTPDEARAWLPEGARGPKASTTLAELYGLGGEYL